MYRGTSSDATKGEELDPFDLTLGDPEALDKIRHDQNQSRAASRLAFLSLVDN